jgi:hypothetical protein
MIWSRVRYLPPESAVASISRDGKPHWGLTEILAAHVWQAAAHSKQPHPMLADAMHGMSRPVSPERAKALKAARARARERRRAIAAGEIT